jgi:hypothetical protein
MKLMKLDKIIIFLSILLIVILMWVSAFLIQENRNFQQDNFSDTVWKSKIKVSDLNTTNN